MGDNIICWQLNGGNWMLATGCLWNVHWWTNHPLLGGRYWVGRCWTGRPDRSPLHSWGGHYWIAFWQNVKRRGLQCPSSHQNTVWWIRRAFSSDSQNTDWCRQGCWNNIPEGVGNGWVSFFLFLFPYIPLFITFRFVDSTLLLESETHFFLLPFSKDLTSGRETIVFGRWNYIVWGGKLYCLAHETILFRARFVCFPKIKCIVF